MALLSVGNVKRTEKRNMIIIVRKNTNINYFDVESDFCSTNYQETGPLINGQILINKYLFYLFSLQSLAIKILSNKTSYYRVLGLS